jgi:hypothetical protein
MWDFQRESGNEVNANGKESALDKYKKFMSSETKRHIKLGVLFLLLHFVLTSPGEIWLLLNLDLLVVSESGDIYLDYLLLNLLGPIVWICALTVALLNIFGRRTLGYVFVLVAVLISTVLFWLTGGDSGNWERAFNSGVEQEPLGFVLGAIRYFSTLILLPLGLILSASGRPEKWNSPKPK